MFQAVIFIIRLLCHVADPREPNDHLGVSTGRIIFRLQESFYLLGIRDKASSSLHKTHRTACWTAWGMEIIFATAGTKFVLNTKSI